MTVAVVTPWHNRLELWDAYLAAMEAGPMPDELLVVDNASDPELEFGSLRLTENLGFCGGSNTGLAAATTDVVVFINNDVAHTDDGWLEKLVATVQPGVLVGAELRTDAHAWVDGQVVPYLDGWCLAGMREDLLDLGGFDTTLVEPAYYSDNLLCLEARAAGFSLRETRIGLRHIGGVRDREHRLRVRAATVANRDVYLARARQLLTPGPEAVGATR